jgi:hypothetical protein
VGDVLKQGRYEPQRCYHFPQVDRRRNAKIDVYQHIGSCLVAVDPDSTSVHSVGVTTTDPGFSGMRLKVSVATKGDHPNKQLREERTKQLKNQAKDYLSKHGIEERLSDAVKALLKEQPADPTEFLCRQLRGSNLPPDLPSPPANKAEPVDLGEVLLPVPGESNEEDTADSLRDRAFVALTTASKEGNLLQALETMVQEKPQEEKVQASESGVATDLTEMRKQACDVLLKASAKGELMRVLTDMKTPEPDPFSRQTTPSGVKELGLLRREACDVLLKASETNELNEVLASIGPVPRRASKESQAAAPAPAAPAAPAAAPATEVAAPPALVVAKLAIPAVPEDPSSKPVIMPSTLLTGPSFASMGPAPGLMFI